MINIINYIKKLVDEKDSASSKIAMGLMFAFFTILLIIAKIVIQSIPMDVLYFSGGMVLSLFGLNSIDKFRKNSNDSSVVNTETHTNVEINKKEEQIT